MDEVVFDMGIGGILALGVSPTISQILYFVRNNSAGRDALYS